MQECCVSEGCSAYLKFVPTVLTLVWSHMVHTRHDDDDGQYGSERCGCCGMTVMAATMGGEWRMMCCCGYSTSVHAFFLWNFRVEDGSGY